jgi:hypothetical protein
MRLLAICRYSAVFLAYPVVLSTRSITPSGLRDAQRVSSGDYAQSIGMAC